MDRWVNKIAVITGASSGIGAACCKALVAKGMIVVGLARRYDRMEKELKASLPEDQRNRFHALKCDVSQEENILKSFKWIEDNLGSVDVLVNNAGIFKETQIVAENNTDALKACIDVNIMGVALCTREAFRIMKNHGINGHVILINSVVGHYVPNMKYFNLNIYPSTKFALTAMTEVLRQEFMNNNTKIKITSISPGGVDTEIIPRDLSGTIADMPFLKSEDIADAVVYCIQTPPHVQIHEMIIKPMGEEF